MAISDPIADMLTRMRNAIMARHDSVLVPASRMKLYIAKILRQDTYPLLDLLRIFPLGHIVTKDFCGSTCEGSYTLKNLNGCCFSSSVRTEKSKDFSLIKLKGYAVNGPEVSILLDKGTYFHNLFCHYLHNPKRPRRQILVFGKLLPLIIWRALDFCFSIASFFMRSFLLLEAVF